MKVSILHPTRALVSLSAVLLVMFCLGAVTAAAVTQVEIKEPVPVFGMPKAPDMRVIREGTAFTVPQTKKFVLTGLGRTSGSVSMKLDIDGVDEIELTTGAEGGHPSIHEVPVGFSVAAGKVITLTSSSGANGRAWGYLEYEDD